MKNGLPIKIDLPKDFLKEETRCQYTVSHDMKELWAIELDLLQEFTRICKKHNIQYMACAGTMLGAVRHKGFIPWDDDIDLMMTWKNYKKLCSIGPSEFKHPYFFQTEQIDRGCTRGHIQIRNSDTTAILMNNLNKGFKFNQGIFIDVFCLDHLPDDSTKKKRFINKVKKLKILSVKAAKCTYRYTEKVRKSTPFFKRIIKDIIYPVMKFGRIEEKIYDLYEKNIHKYNCITTKEMGLVCFPLLGERYFWKKEDVESKIINVPFEFMTIPLPSNYNEILEKTYGNWREYEVGTSNHGELFIDVRNSYKKYI